ncbi:hypothetical protein AHF37_04637 [Paragonimus kellicotti]|nr:hypothetical protein AHF37_04637 [Paragonimus kellicotti]
MGDIDLSSLKDALNSECTAFPQLKSLDLEGISDIIKAGKVKNVIVMAGAGISTGTSLTVTPFSLMVDQVRLGVPRLYINRDVSEIGFNGIPWDDPKNKSDVVFRGDADVGVTKLAELLGWKDLTYVSAMNKLFVLAAGIPDFRSPQSGIYDNLDEYNLPFPLAVFSIDYFHIDPSPFFKVARRLYRPDAKPTLTHYFFRLLTEKHLLKRLYTQVRRAYCVQLGHQNVDGLERLAGIDDTVVVEAHGTFNTGHCVNCKKLYDFEYMKNLILNDEIPKCVDKDCNGVVKPGMFSHVCVHHLITSDIVFFGEQLPRKFFASRGNGIPWDDPKNKSDVVFRGDADVGVTKLAELLGWKDELLELKRKTDAQLGESKPIRADSDSNTGSSK